MADSKLTGLTANTTPALTDILYIVDDPGGSPLSQKITVANLLAVSTPGFTGPVTITEAVGSSGLTITGATQTSSFPALSITQTWNSAGTTFTGIKANITATASAAASLVMDLQVGGTSVFKVSKTGELSIGAFGGIGLTGSIQTYQAGVFSSQDNDAYGLRIFTTYPLTWSSDLALYRDAAAILALRQSTNAQTFRVYETYTDGSNYERAALSCASNTVTLAAETAGTGSDDMDVAFTPAGAGLMKFGSHSAVGAETITGYITIKDSGGTSRKIAVIS